MKTYKVKEIFGPTLQGEGTHALEKVYFLRFAGCNKWSGKEDDRPKSICWYCDTDFVGGEKMTSKEIVKALGDLDGKVKHVVISGGEPSLQLDEDLLVSLTDAGYYLHLETNGSRDLKDLHRHFYHITMSPKQSPEKTKLKSCDDLKILYPFIDEEITPITFANFNAKAKYLQPVHSDSYDKNLKNTIDKIYLLDDWKLSLQLHKIMGVE